MFEDKRRHPKDWYRLLSRLLLSAGLEAFFWFHRKTPEYTLQSLLPRKKWTVHL